MIIIFNAELKEFLDVLDQRYETRLKRDGVQMAKKMRRIGEVSCRGPPQEAPQWTLNPAGQHLDCIIM